MKIFYEKELRTPFKLSFYILLRFFLKEQYDDLGANFQ